MLMWTQLACSEWQYMHLFKHNSYTLLTNLTTFSTYLFFYFRKIDSNGESYTGGYKQGKRNGRGEEEFKDGSREIAYYDDDKKEGAAKYYDKNGNEQDRFYKNHKLVDDSGNFIDSDSSSSSSSFEES